MTALNLNSDASPGEMIANIRALKPFIDERVEAIESGRRIPKDVAQKLRELGVFRIGTPKSHGGLEYSYPDILEVMTEVSALDGSVGWVVMLNVGHMPQLALLPRAAFDKVYSDTPDIAVSGSAAPSGTAEIVDGGYLVSGRWPFGSGCHNADWTFGGAIITRNGEPVMRPDGKMPLSTHVALPATAWEIEDTWHVAGLKGTGSHHFSLKDVFVPEESTFDFQRQVCVPGPLYGSPFHLIPLLHGAPAIGIAQAAIESLTEMAKGGKKQLLMEMEMQDSEVFQTELGRLDAQLRGARAAHRAQAKALWDKAVETGLRLHDTDILGDCFQNVCWVTDVCVDIVEKAYRLGGGSALYESSPLQRHLRDIHGASQHAAVHPMGYMRSGQALLGQKVRHPIVD